MVYCTENHIKLHNNDPATYWEDIGMISHLNGQNMPIPMGVHIVET